MINEAPLKDEMSVIEYFGEEAKTDNRLTRLLNGMNVVTIVIETGDAIMLNETLTSNLYNMFNDGINCTNNVSKNKTNISKFIGITCYASTSSIDHDRYQYNLPYSIVNMLPDSYRTIYAHDVGGDGDGNCDIYNIKALMPMLGFDEAYLHEDLRPDLPMWDWSGNYVLDTISLERTCDKLFNGSKSPFYLFYTSLAMHGPYTMPSNRSKLYELYGQRLTAAKVAGKWENPLEGTFDSICIDNYMMAAMDFDTALGNMLDRFESEGILDNTLFVLYGDHEIYYNGFENVPLGQLVHNCESINNPNLYPTILGFYNPTLNKKFYRYTQSHVINEFSSPYNIVPTILDLLGVKYNANFYIGSSLFSPQFKNKVQAFYSLELSAFFNQDFWTGNSNSIDIIFNEDANQEEFIAEVNRLMEKQAYIDMIITNDYFSSNNFELYNYR